MKIKIIVCLLFVGVLAKANIVLPAVIGSNMVLQQRASVKFWGWGNPGEKLFLTPSWSNHTDSTIVTGDGKWQILVNTPAAGGPFDIIIKADNTIRLTNVLIGEVWVCSGQSNMEMNYNWGLPDVKNELPRAGNPNIRFFSIPRTTALYPQENCSAQWTACDSNTLKSFSAVAYFFGKRLHKELNVPVGLINASWGGTPAETWTPAPQVNADLELKKAATQLPVSRGWPVTPGYTFNGMLSPITSYNIAGAIWYQGEGNTAAPNSYEKLLRTMITSWRREWNKNLPFYYVQIAPFTYGRKYVGALIREQQLKAASLSNTGMAVITDLVDDVHDIHPKNKHDVGLRLANLALANTYNKKIAAASPLYKDFQIVKNKILVSFTPAEELVIKGKKPAEIFIAGADKVFYPAEAKIQKGQLLVWHKKIKQPVAVRYAFSNTAIGNLFGKNGLPVSPFRTDEWDLALLPEGK